MIPAVILPVVRRAIVDLLNDIGGEQNDATLTMLLVELGHPVARRDIREQLVWLAEDGRGLIAAEELGSMVVARLLQDGRDLADGRLRIDGVSRFKTAD